MIDSAKNTRILPSTTILSNNLAEDIDILPSICYIRAPYYEDLRTFIITYTAQCTSKETGLEVNTDKTTYMVTSREQTVGLSHTMKTDNNSIERVEEFKYLGTMLTNQNSVQKEIKSRLKLGNACYHSVQKLLSSILLTKNLKIKIYKTIILPVVLYGCETWSLTLREECRLRCLRTGC